MKNNKFFLLFFIILALFSVSVFSEIIVNDDFERSNFESTSFWNEYCVTTGCQNTPIRSAYLNSLAFGWNGSHISNGVDNLRQSDMVTINGNLSIKFTLSIENTSYVEDSIMYRLTLGNGSLSTNPSLVGNEILKMQIHELYWNFSYYNGTTTKYFCSWGNASLITKPYAYNVEWYVDTDGYISSFYVFNYTDNELIYNCSYNFTSLNYNNQTSVLKQILIERAYTSTPSKFYLDNFYMEDEAGSFGYATCDNSPVITEISTANENPVCIPVDIEPKNLYFNVSTFDSCNNYAYFSCIDCSVDLSYNIISTYKEYFNNPTSTNNKYNYDRTDRNLTFRNSKLYLNNTVALSLKHCLYNNENYTTNCAPVDANFDVDVLFRLLDTDLPTVSATNPLDIRFINSNGDYIAIFLINISTTNFYQIYYYADGDYRLWSYDDYYATAHNIKINVAFDIEQQFWTMNVYPNADQLILSDELSGEFLETTNNINSIEFYQDICLSNFTLTAGCDNPNYIEDWLVNLPTTSYLSQGYIQTIPVLSEYDSYVNLSNYVLSTGNHFVNICVYNENSSSGYYIDCEKYIFSIKNKCTAQELLDDGYEINGTIVDETDLLNKFTSFIETMGAKSLGSKMVIGMLILIFLIIAIAMATGGNVIAISVVAVAGLMTMAVMGLFPVWVIVLTIVVCGIAVFVFFSSKGGS